MAPPLHCPGFLTIAKQSTRHTTQCIAPASTHHDTTIAPIIVHAPRIQPPRRRRLLLPHPTTTTTTTPLLILLHLPSNIRSIGTPPPPLPRSSERSETSIQHGRHLHPTTASQSVTVPTATPHTPHTIRLQNKHQALCETPHKCVGGGDSVTCSPATAVGGYVAFDVFAGTEWC